MNSPANDDELAELLRGAASPLPDAGFSQRVLAALPAPEPKWKLQGRIAICLAGGAAGCGFALWQGVSGSELKFALQQFAAHLAGAGLIFADPLMLGALILTMFSLLFAFRVELRDRLMA